MRCKILSQRIFCGTGRRRHVMAESSNWFAALKNRRVRTPEEVFGAAVRHKTYYGTIIKKDHRAGCVVVRYDDHTRHWFPRETVDRWLVPEDGFESDASDSEYLSDQEDPQEEVDEQPDA